MTVKKEDTVLDNDGHRHLFLVLPLAYASFCRLFSSSVRRTKARGLAETICEQSRKLCGSEACHITKGRDQEDVLLGAVIVSALLARTFPYR